MIENQSEEQEQYPKRPSETAILSNGLFWPPGCAGKLAFFLYDCAYLPVPEIAIISTLAILAGLAGRSFNISGKGLNLYLILVAKSATGKEHMSTGINLLLNATNNGFLEREFVIYDEFASGPALIKAVCDNPCMLNINGEFGHKLKGMATCTDNPSSPMYSLRKVITELYEKSGSSSKLGGIKYSNKDNNVTGIIAPAYSMLGDTTPGKFYEALTRDMMADGFMSRFTIVEYEGDRVRDNSYHQHFSIPSPELANWFKPFKQYCLECKEIKSVIYQKTGNDLLNAFKDECNVNIKRSGDDESRRQMWNRAHMKALKIAALLAVADNYDSPLITTVHAEWAIKFVQRENTIFTKRINSGDIGMDDDSREAKLLSIIKEFLLADQLPTFISAFSPMQKRGVIPIKYLTARTQKIAAFANHKLGATKALHETINLLVNGGRLSIVQQIELRQQYSYSGKAYRALVLDDNFKIQKQPGVFWDS